MSEKKVEIGGVTINGGITVNGPMFEIHDNQNVYVGKPQVEGPGVSDRTADGHEAAATPKEELNYFAPKKNLQEMLKGEWFVELRTNEKYDAQWTDEFVEALMESEWGDEIARDWAGNGKRNRVKQIKGYVVGLLSDAGVLKGSYGSIAERMGMPGNPRTLSKYMSDGKLQGYAEWVREVFEL